MKISVLTPTIRPQGLVSIQETLAKQTMQDFEWLVELSIPEKGYDLNRAYNRMIRRAKGDLLVICQDHVFLPPDALQKWYDAFLEKPDTLFTAPLGKVDKLGDTPRWDWRAGKQNESQVKYTDCRPHTLELDWGAIPKKAVYDIGGWDEEMDRYWAMDNISVGIRAEAMGYKFACFFENPAVVYDHDKFTAHPFRQNFNPREANAHMATYKLGTPLPYLQQ